MAKSTRPTFLRGRTLLQMSGGVSEMRGFSGCGAYTGGVGGDTARGGLAPLVVEGVGVGEGCSSDQRKAGDVDFFSMQLFVNS